MTANTGNTIDTRAAPAARRIAPSQPTAELSPVRANVNED